jgi:hypothetical protein
MRIISTEDNSAVRCNSLIDTGFLLESDKEGRQDLCSQTRNFTTVDQYIFVQPTTYNS